MGLLIPLLPNELISTLAGGVESVFAVDLDNDGHIDVLSGGGVLKWYKNDGITDPSFTTHTVSGPASRFIYAEDVDSDGDIDLLTAGDNNVTWFESDGAPIPSFIAHSLSNTEYKARAIHAADMDNDGDVDVLSCAINPGNTWFENDGSEAFTRHDIVTMPSWAWALDVADIDNDGNPDILFYTTHDRSREWYKNDGGSPPVFTPQAISDWGEYGVLVTNSMYAADLDNDGDLDVMSTESGNVVWYENDGSPSPSFTYRIVTDYPDYPASVQTGDLDGDGDLDVIAGQYCDTEIDWYENNGVFPPSFSLHSLPFYTLYVRQICSCDLDRDGDIDLLSASWGDDKIAWYENDGSATFSEHIISASTDVPWDVYCIDLDGDGDNDVLSASRGDDTIAWYENDGSENFTQLVISSSADGAQKLYATDLDADGDIDVLSASNNDNKIAWYESDGNPDPLFTERIISTNASNAQSVYAIDLDGDGDIDVLSASEDDNKIAWYENDGMLPPSFSPYVISTLVIDAETVYAADVDNDGDNDVLSASKADNKIRWFENDGSQPPSFTEHVISSVAPYAYDVNTRDLDNDGDLDVLSTSWGDHKIAWYENLLEPPRQWETGICMSDNRRYVNRKRDKRQGSVW